MSRHPEGDKMQRGWKNNLSIRVRGFTLVEMLVALMIGSLLVVSVVSATRALARTRASIDRRVERSAAGRQALETIVAALRNVRRDPIRRKPVLVGRRGATAQEGDRIDLLVLSARRARADGAESDQYEMSFSLEQRPGAALPVLVCRKDHALDDYPDDGGLVTVVAEGIVGLSFMYLSGEEWMNEWPELSVRPPDAVRVTVAAAQMEPAPGLDRGEFGGAMTLSTVVPINVTQPAGERPGRPSGGESKPGGPKR
jgi:prepilin-type N-terminal cleavage/methylation domain-containing protein